MGFPLYQFINVRPCFGWVFISSVGLDSFYGSSFLGGLQFFGGFIFYGSSFFMGLHFWGVFIFLVVVGWWRAPLHCPP